MACLIVTLYYLAIFFFALILFFNLPFSPLSNKNGLPRNWPILGMVPSLIANINNILDWMVAMMESSGVTTFMFKGPWFCNLNLLITLDPANIKYTSSTRFSNFPRGPKSRELFDLFGEGFFNLDGKEWEVHRNIHRSFFNHKQFNECSARHAFEKVEKGMTTVLDCVANGGKVGGGESGVVNLEDLFSRYTYDLTNKLVVGFDPERLSLLWPQVLLTKEMNNAMQSIWMRHFLPDPFWKLLRFLGVGYEKTLRKSKDTLHKFMIEIVSSKRGEFIFEESKTHGEFSDILTTYLMEEDYYRSKRSNEVLKGSLLSLLLAGSGTSTAALTWFFWILSEHPSIETKIRDEIAMVVPDDDREKLHMFNLKEISNLIYLHAAICETLRMYPPIPFQTRAPLEKDVLPSGHEVNPNSTMVIIPLYNLARAKLVWGEDCKEFKPERWICEDGGFKHEPSNKFFSFNSGPRICLGRDLAFTQMKVAIATILHNYNVQVLKEQKVIPVYSVVLQTKYGLQARVSKRWA